MKRHPEPGELEPIERASRDELQAVIAGVQAQDFPVALQFQNFRD